MNIKTKWLCPHCSEEHDSTFAAEYCCPRGVREVYFCGECGKRFDWEELRGAKQCCVEKVRLAALEVLKRQCLCGEVLTDDDVHDAAILGSVPRCRACILKVAPELIAA